MSKVLALDTSSDLCSVSLHLNHQFYSISELAPRKHGELLMPMITRLLKEQDIALKELDAIAFGCGPGSFTGLRIAAGVTQGLAYGLDCPVIPVSNLRALALQGFEAHKHKHVLVSIDARMDEVYWSLMEVDESSNELVSSSAGEHVTKPEALDMFSGIEPSSDFSVVGVGSGFEFVDRYPAQARASLDKIDVSMRPHAEAICKLAVQDFQEGIFCQPEQAAPVYIRDQVAWKKLPGRE